MTCEGSWRSRAVGVALLALGLVVASPTRAADGVIEINQTRALEGGITPLDSPGFPVHLGTPGSYRLTGDLSVADPDLKGIVIVAEGTTLDLNGFQISGPVSCSGSGSTIVCDPETTFAAAHGIMSTAGSFVIKNGHIRGFREFAIWSIEGNCRVEKLTIEEMAEGGVRVGDNCVIHDVVATRVGGPDGCCSRGTGIWAGSGSVVSGCVSNSNRSGGINVGSGSTVANNTASTNGYDGILCGTTGDDGACTVRGNTVYANERLGISTGGGSLIVQNTVKSNGWFGLWVSSSDPPDARASLTGNVFWENNGGNANDQIFPGPGTCGTPTSACVFELTPNQCGSDTTCP